MHRTAVAAAAERAARRRRVRMQRAAALLVLGAAAVGLAVLWFGNEPSDPAGPRLANSPAATERSEPRQPRRTSAALAAPPAEVRGSAARRMRIPILMYHVVTSPPAGVANAELWIPEDRFREHMHALRRAGYHAITLRQAFAGWRRGAGLPRRPVVVTFDDGYLSHYTKARPVLRALGWPGVLNLKVGNVGRDGISTRQVKALIAAGWELDAHTISHPDLTTLTADALRHEVAGSRRALRRRFGVRVDFFCYPAGRYDARVIAAVEAAGYRGATTTVEGYASAGNPYELKRVRVNGGDTAAALMDKLDQEH